MVETIPLRQARRIALAAQGFGKRHPVAAGTRALHSTIEKLGLLQIDSVNVFERSHYLPLFARLGAYDRSALDRLTFSGNGRYLEYWAHEAAIIPREAWPLFRWRMEEFRRKDASPASWASAHSGLLDWLRAELAEKGPLAARAIEHDANRRSGPWWGWSDVKVGLEILFRWGEVVSVGRARFERVYGLAHHVLPAEILAHGVAVREAHKQLVEHAARAQGIATTSDITDYFRLKNVPVAQLLLELAEEGVVRKVQVPGWKRTAWLHRDARSPRAIESTALLSPFDPVVWHRDRAERLFDFHYRIEIYTPAAKREFGYYSLPILLDEELVGRIDLKNDRQAGILRVQSAWHEAHAHPGTVAERLAPLLERTRQWQGLSSIEVRDRGNLAHAVASALRMPPAPND